MKQNAVLIFVIVAGLTATTLLSRFIDGRRTSYEQQFAEEPLYVNGPTAKRLSLAFDGLAADWYWMRSLQYVGGKIVAYKDQHDGRMDFGSLQALKLNLLPQLLEVSTTLDPHFIAPYEYGAMILPEVDSNQAVALLNYGVAQNPSTWRLYQHLGYIYWQRKEYEKASEVYAAGAKIPGVPSWMAAMSARMKAEGGSRDAAREMFLHLSETSTDDSVKQMVVKQLIRLNSLDERDAIRRTLNDFKTRTGRCASSWREVTEPLLAAGLQIERGTGAPIDPSGTPYDLIKNGCDVGLNINTRVPLK